MNKLKFITTIEARMTSTRLPGKVLKKFHSTNPLYNNLSCLQILIERIKGSKFISEIIIATSDNNKDDEIEHFCKNNNIKCFRGSEHDVLGRLAGALTHSTDEHVIQLTGDNPFIDPKVIDYTVGIYCREYPRYDFVTNNGLLNPNDHEIPLGMDMSVFPAQKLIDNSLLAQDNAYREHPTLFFYKNSREIFKCLNVPIPSNWKRKRKIRLTFDTNEDYYLLQSIYNHFSKTNIKFSLEEILNFLDKNHKLIDLNSNIKQKIPIIKNL